ncbi:MAG: HAD-IA family hydrolase [Opitutaceae bacterium]|nr:HAD-IA family hydrolase [Opitutaceae bacterium]
MKAPEAVDFARVEVVTFDAAGTLLRPHPSVGAVYREVALTHGCDLPEDALDQAFRTAFHAVSKDPAVLDPEGRERDFWRRVVLHAFRSLGRAPARFDAFFEELWDTFAHGARWRVYERAPETLATLRARGYRLGVLSNWDNRLHRVLEETGLRVLFEVVTISSEAGAEKPDTAIFRRAEAAHAIAPALTLHIGDSLKHDIEGARAAGWPVLRVRHDGGPAAPGEIGCLSQLLELLPGR